MDQLSVPHSCEQIQVRVLLPNDDPTPNVNSDYLGIIKLLNPR